MPHFIVTYGPAGSGKGHIRDEYRSYLHNIHDVIFDENNTFEANIDSYVEKDEKYAGGGGCGWGRGPFAVAGVEVPAVGAVGEAVRGSQADPVVWVAGQGCLW